MSATCFHSFEYRSQACTRCGLTAEAIAAGRDKPATWTDVDAAYEHGVKTGEAMANAHWRYRRRRKVFQVGAYWALRRMRASL